MRYRLQRHDGTDCSATMVPFTVLRMVPIQRYRQHPHWLNQIASKTGVGERYGCFDGASAVFPGGHQ